MPKREPMPRNARYLGMHTAPLMLALGTWLEAEEITYPSGAMIRRARAVDTNTGRLRIVRCGIPDTCFTIPCKGGGYLDQSDGGILRYHPPGRERTKIEVKPV